MNDKFLKPFNSAEAEARIAELWEKSGYFNPDNLPQDKSGRFTEPFSIVLPPPNVTGNLHMGSALMLAIEDIMVRYARMQGKRTLWIPGTDHAAIATQAKVEREIQKKEGKSRHDLGREELLKRIDIFAKESHDVIVTQIKKMGASIDWSREAFTLDEKRNLAVRTTFKKMYDDGLIYRGFRVVNWDPKGQTTISDDEIVDEPRKAKLYTFKYSKNIPISISTTRPETKLGDTAIAVHPEDARYKQYIGKEFDAVFAGEPIHLKVIADIAVDPEFGTGALGVTPAHSTIDWEMAQRHDLPLKQVINEYAKMTVGAVSIDGGGGILGKKTTEAREAVVTWLKNEGLLEKEEDVEQNVSTAERTGGIIEPLPKLQWFIGVNKKFKHSDGREVTLKELMIEAVSGGATKILPDRFEKVYLHWIENLRDWCISRQIWYGHRIPAYYLINEKENQNALVNIKNSYLDTIINALDLGNLIRKGKDNGDITSKTFDPMRIDSGTIISFGSLSYLLSKKILDIDDITKNLQGADFSMASPSPSINPPTSGEYVQDFDTLDTWFSSGLWTFSTLGWPDEKEFAKHRMYHPTTILETGYDILFFWVARMILMSKYILGEVPFKTVYLHGLVRDGQGRKVSKSLGNNIDPLDMIAKYGADAVRMSLIIGTGPGSDSKISDDKIKGYRNFSNKLWNITRYILTSVEGTGGSDKIVFDAGFSAWSDADKKLLEEQRALLTEITREMDEYKFYLVAEKLYHYAWHTFADVILEDSKKIFAGTDADAKNSRKQFLLHTLNFLLKTLHPFMPFVTEEIWGSLDHGNDSAGKELLMITQWPK